LWPIFAQIPSVLLVEVFQRGKTLSSSCPLEDLAAFGEDNLTEKQRVAVKSHRSDLAALIDGTLTGTKRDAMDSHLSNCRFCRDLVTEAWKAKNAAQQSNPPKNDLA
jgi:hypothetical protein